MEINTLSNINSDKIQIVYNNYISEQCNCRTDDINDMCRMAAYNGHLECLKFAHEHGYKWDEWTCYYAAYNGHIECLKYAHINGCEWNKIICMNASRNIHVECFDYITKNI